MRSTEKDLFSYTPLNNYKEYFLYALIYVMFITLMQLTGHHGDNGCWSSWSNYIVNQGIGNVYHAGTDYPPLYYYVLDLYGHLMGSEESIIKNIYWLKSITFLAEFGSIFLLFRYVKKENQPWLFLFIMLNPGFFYNSLIWGQVDGIFGFLTISMVLLAIHRKNTFALICFILCLNFKVQGIIFLPLLILLLIHNLSDYKGFLHALFVILILIGLQTLIILPFIINGTLELLWTAVMHSVGKYSQVSINAYNMHYWLFEGNPTEIEDAGIWKGISYKNWGMICFFIASAFTLIPIFVTSIQSALHRNADPFKLMEKVFLSAALIGLSFFFFNTQMHERYSHYALIFLAAYFAVAGNYLPFLCCATACFLNEESVLRVLNLPNYDVAIFYPKAIAVLYAVIIVYLYYLLYAGSDLLNNIKLLAPVKTQK